MPVSRKRFSVSRKIFSKKRVKKSVKKNTRKHKKRTPRRKYRKSGKRLRFFGGFGEDDDCAICTEPLSNGNEVFTTNCLHNFHRACIEQWCNGKAVCPCPMCKTPLDPNPNPNPNTVLPNTDDDDDDDGGYPLYRIQFFTFVNNPQTGEIDRVPISVNDMTDREIGILTNYFIQQFPNTHDDNYVFFDDAQGTNGYIELDDDQLNVVIQEGNMDIRTNPPIRIRSATITLTNSYN